MNAFNRLTLEYEGIVGKIREYTDEPQIDNYMNRLKNAIDKADFEAIKYCLNAIYEWYKQNINAIHTNQYVYNPGLHDKNLKLIKELHDTITHEDCLSNKDRTSDSVGPIIFLSHKSDDKKYGDALRDFIVGLGVNNNQLIYTSHPLHKIPLDANIYDYLRQHINSKIFMIILWSNKYLDSPACLNEMGAAWVTRADYTNIYVPSFSFGNPKYHECAVDTRKMGAVLNGDEHCKASMRELKKKIQDFFGLKDDENNSGYLLDKFINSISQEHNE